MARKLTADALNLQRQLSSLFAQQANDLRLRDHLIGLETNRTLGSLTWFWGPQLYRRNRVVFREFILRHFSEWGARDFSDWWRVAWRDHEQELEGWLAEARAVRDTSLVKRLLAWKYGNDVRWGLDEKAFSAALLAEHQAATSPAAQAIVLEEFDQWFSLDEAAATTLYRSNPAARAFVLKHLPTRFSFWGEEKRALWRPLFEAALAANDHELAFALYRRQIPLKQWRQDVEQLANTLSSADQLNDELRRRHPEGWGLKLVDTIVILLRIRGREVFPYVRDKLSTIAGGWYGSDPEALLKLARDQGWWDLWAAVVRSAARPNYFNAAVKELLDDTQLDKGTRQSRLEALAGVSREWNWPGLGMATVHTLEDHFAARLYRQFPQLVRGPFKPHVVPRYWQGGPYLFEAASAAQDEELLDLLASRYVTRSRSGWEWDRAATDAILDIAGTLNVSFQRLREHDPATFARRAANVLTQVPAFAIHNYHALLETNAFARLLFVRSFASFLAQPSAVRDLVEGSEIHVQMLGYRVLAVDDKRARQLGHECLDILLGTLWRPLHRKTRLAAFAALANTAKVSEAVAQRILQRARAALRLPDKKYPKEELVGLIGEILHQWPALRSARERPIIYGLAEATP